MIPRFTSVVALLAIPASLPLMRPAVGQTIAPHLDTTLYHAMEWRNIGPFRGGRAVAVAGVISQPFTYYFGGVGGGVWKSDNAGVDWTNVSDGFFNTASVGAVAVAPSDPNVVYAGMGEHAVRGVMTSHGDGVYRSTDAGRTWTHLGLDRSRAISTIVVHPTDPDVVYVGVQGAPYGPTAERGVYRSTDGGATWRQVHQVNETAGVSSMSMDPNNPRIIFAAYWDHLREPWRVRSGGPGSGIFRTKDGGDTWERLAEGLPELVGKIGVSVAANGDRVYAIVEADPGGGLFRSDDGGESWSNVNETWTIRARAWYYMKVFADPVNPDVVWVLNAPVMKSIDGGRTFARVQTPHGDNHALWINPTNPLAMINGNDGGANVSLDGGKSWSTQQNQPTAQFYRVNTDDLFPYNVYAGQQDNSALRISSRTAGNGIGWQDWESMPGCETARPAFDRRNPVYVYGGCYMGIIGEMDTRTRLTRDVMAYPDMPAALASRDMKYRYNWSAPNVVSQHDGSVIYHAANVVLRSSDRGRSWVEISPDLTRDEDAKQGPGGGPITNEGAGGEIYGTIYYLAESPHDAGTLWSGSDDGMVHVTRDGGANWEDVTPDGMGEAMVNAIEVSPHDPATAYLAVTRYKFNDFTPHFYKTDDYGRSWDRIVNGIPEEAWARVIREDPVRPELLYAGTETGMFVSFDGGDRWQSLQLNLPITPITDLQVQATHNDLVAATQGRSFWILDDLSPLQQAPEEIVEGGVHLFAPRVAYRYGGGAGTGSSVGRNPPSGAVLNFYLAEQPDTTVTVEVLDASGDAIRTYRTDAAENSGMDELEIQGGMNRIAWNYRHATVKNVPGLYVFGTLQGRKAVPGRYTARLTVGDRVVSQPFELRANPLADATLADYRAQDDLVAAIDRELVALHEGVIALRAVREQIAAVLERAEGNEGKDTLDAMGGVLTEEMTALEDSLIQKRTVDGQTVINFPTRLNFGYVYLRGAVDGAEGIVNEGARERFSDLSMKWSAFSETLETLLGPRLQDFNDLIEQYGVPAVRVGRPRDRPIS